jgi:hypothetical protein
LVGCGSFVVDQHCHRKAAWVQGPQAKANAVPQPPKFMAVA